MRVERCHIEALCIVFSGPRCLLHASVYMPSVIYKCVCTVTNSVYGPSKQLVMPSIGLTGAGRAAFDISNLAQHVAM